MNNPGNDNTCILIGKLIMRIPTVLNLLTGLPFIMVIIVMVVTPFGASALDNLHHKASGVLGTSVLDNQQLEAHFHRSPSEAFGDSVSDNQPSPGEKKNILLILVDDLRPAIGAYGNEVAITPEMDKLASEATRFTKAYANQAVCAPSRLNLMLGSRSTSTGIYDFGRDFRDFYPDATVMPQYFKRHGYHAESMGKVYHIGHGTYNDTASWSIPHYKDKVIEYNDPASTGGKLTREEALFANKSWDYAGSLPRGAAWESPKVADTAYADGRVANHAVERLRVLKQESDKPFFMAVGFARPHMPFSVPQKYWDMYDPRELPISLIEHAPEWAPAYAGQESGQIEAYNPVPTPAVHKA